MTVKPILRGELARGGRKAYLQREGGEMRSVVVRVLPADILLAAPTPFRSLPIVSFVRNTLLVHLWERAHTSHPRPASLPVPLLLYFSSALICLFECCPMSTTS